MKKSLIVMAGMLGIVSQADLHAGGRPATTNGMAALRVKVSGVATHDWLTGKLVEGQGCTMVKLDRPTQEGYTSMLLVGLLQMQSYQAGQWTEVAIGPMVKKEPAPCRLGGSD